MTDPFGRTPTPFDLSGGYGVFDARDGSGVWYHTDGATTRYGPITPRETDDDGDYEQPPAGGGPRGGPLA